MEDLPCAESCEWEVCNGRDEHHLYWPKNAYRDSVGKRFRSLPMNVVELCINEHREIHATEEPPEHPTRDEMLEALNE